VTARAFLALFGLLLLVPSANYQVFDGVPWSRLPEFFRPVRARLERAGPLPIR